MISQNFADTLEQVRKALPSGLPVYLVGGAVRDLMLGRPTHDLDFVLTGDVLQIARRVANSLGGAFYPLDVERKTGRVILAQPGARRILDFADFRGPDLESDLRARDFTVNAMAVPVDSPSTIIDPLGGAQDLRAARLRACSENSLRDDPLRILRGVRLSTAFSLRILPETKGLMREAASLLHRVSPERIRDELFRILGSPQPATSLTILDRLTVLPLLLPELAALHGVAQPPPHISDVWTHTMAVLQSLELVLGVLSPQHDAEAAASLISGLISVRIGRYREQLHAHLSTTLSPDRSVKDLLMFAALYHDVGKPGTLTIDDDERIRFFGHDELGAQVAADRARQLRLSNEETERLRAVVRHHLRPFLLAQTGERPTKRAVYRFFRDTGAAGIDICILSLADVLATYGPTLPQEKWVQHLDVVRALLEAWWEYPEERVAPPTVLNGHDLIASFDLEAGPLIGALLEDVREAQAEGRVKDRADALRFVEEQLRDVQEDKQD